MRFCLALGGRGTRRNYMCVKEDKTGIWDSSCEVRTLNEVMSIDCLSIIMQQSAWFTCDQPPVIMVSINVKMVTGPSGHLENIPTVVSFLCTLASSNPSFLNWHCRNGTLHDHQGGFQG